MMAFSCLRMQSVRLTHPRRTARRAFVRGEAADWPRLEVRLFQWFVVALGLSGAIALANPIATTASASTAALAREPIVASQADDTLGAAADAARQFSLLEAERDFDALYDRMHPDARAVVPRSAVVGWYESFFANRETRELTVTDVAFEPWTWEVTGTTYDDARYRRETSGVHPRAGSSRPRCCHRPLPSLTLMSEVEHCGMEQLSEDLQ